MRVPTSAYVLTVVVVAMAAIICYAMVEASAIDSVRRARGEHNELTFSVVKVKGLLPVGKQAMAFSAAV